MKSVFDKFCYEIDYKKSNAFKDVAIIKAKLKNDNLFEIEFNSKEIIPFEEMKIFLTKLSNNFKYKVLFNLNVLSASYNSSEIQKYLDWIIRKYLKNNVLAEIVSNSIVGVQPDGIINFIFVNETIRNKFEAIEKKVLKIIKKFGFKNIAFVSKVNEQNDILKKEKEKLEKEAFDFKVENNKKNQEIKSFNKGYTKNSIKELYKDQHNRVNVLGKVFDIHQMKTKSEMIIFTFSIIDYTEAIYVKMFTSKKTQIENYNSININDNISVLGTLQIDSYTKQQTIFANSIKKVTKITEERYDEANEKRIELSFRTKMSTMDGTLSPKEIVLKAKKWGHKAVAIVDSDSVQSFPDFYYATNNSGIKAIYGATVNLLDKNSKAIENHQDRSLLNDKYVVFDLETSGLSPEFNELIEFGAVVIKDDQILETKQFFIKPSKKIPEEISNLTKITNDMVKNAVSEKEGMQQIIDFIKDKTLVAHNATFDYTFLKTKAKKYGLKEINNPIIDTLITSRIIFPEAKRYRLAYVAKKYNVMYEADIAHRADYDAGILANIFTKQIRDLAILGITNQKILYEYISEKLYEKVFPHSMTILAKNQEGLKELFLIISKSLTNDFYKNGNVFLDDLKLNKNVLLGSGGLTSKLVDLIFTGSKDQIQEEIKKYDYIEIQPLQNFIHKIHENYSWENLHEMIKFIISKAKKQNKIVVATGDVRYLDENEKIYHEIYINAKGLGGVRHYLFNYGDKNKKYPKQHLLTTNEMIKQFKFLNDNKLIKEIVIENTNKIADLIEEVHVIKDKLYTPKIDSADSKLENMVYNQAKNIYGNPLPKIVKDRIKREIEPIKKYGFSVIYWISHLLVDKSLKDGYLVGSRGSVGSSFVATMAKITEVNPLEPHYLCKTCKYSEFYTDSPLNSGYDLKNKNCPKCKTPLQKEGQKIPFETFLGFEADKVPDIDLNFSGDNQKAIHNEVKDIFGEHHSFRAGTISTVAEKTAFGYVKSWAEENEKEISKAYIEFLAKKITGTKRTSGQHPGGIIVIPKNMSVEDFSPINFPANDKTSSWKTTHFDFHAIHDNVLKLDLLGHDDPTALKYLEKLTGVNVKKDIPFYDEKVISLFSSTKELNISSEDIDGEKTGVMGIPEFGTSFVRKMLRNAKVSSFGDLIAVSGLSHGTDVWTHNAEYAIKEEGKTLSEVISCRDNIMTDLISKGISSSLSFQVMEQVRKGNGITSSQEKTLKKNNVENWYIESLKKIKYMFPKAHATAYVMMAWRIAWFKLYHPSAYYTTYFTTRADVFDIESVIKGPEETKKTLKILKSRRNNYNNEKLSNKEIALIPILELVNEAFSRNIKIGNISIKKSKINNWIIDNDGTLIPPFVAVDGLGESVAKSIINARKEKEFTSIEDFKSRSTINNTTLAKLKTLGVLDCLSEKNQISMFDFLV